MAVTIDATAGGANANSYITLSEANTFVEAMINSTDVSKWDTGTDDNRNRAFAAAAQRLDRERFIGCKDNQHAGAAMAAYWCAQARYIRQYIFQGFPFRISEDYFTETEIPDQIKRAQIELAVYLHNNKDGISLSGLNDYKNVKIGNLDVTPDKSGSVGADHVPPMFERYLTGLRISGPGNVAIPQELIMPVIPNAADITAIRRPDGTYVSAVEPLGVLELRGG